MSHTWMRHYPVACPCPSGLESGTCDWYGDDWSGACADGSLVTSCPHCGMFCGLVVKILNPVRGGDAGQMGRSSLPEQFVEPC